MSALLSRYSNSSIEHRHLTPAEAGADSIGHFGFFGKGRAPALWDEVADWLSSSPR